MGRIPFEKLIILNTLNFIIKIDIKKIGIIIYLFG